MSTEDLKTSLEDDISENFDTLAEDEVVETAAVDVEEVEEEVTEDVTEPAEEAVEEETEEVVEEAKTDEVEKIEAKDEDAVEPLAHWLKKDKEEFAELPNPQKEFLIRRDKEFQRTASEKIQESLGVQRALEPLRQELSQHGISDDQAVRTLVGAHIMLTQDPKKGIQHLMSQYQLTPETLFSAEDAAPVTDPRIEALENKATEFEQHAIMRENATLEGQLQEFSKNAEFYDRVVGEMTEAAAIERVRNPSAMPDIKRVYDRACWMNESVREELVARERAGGAKAKSVDRSMNAAGTKVKATAVSKRKTVNGRQAASLEDELSTLYDEQEQRESGTAL